MKFMMKAAQGWMLEVRLGELAKENASHAYVTEFGGMMAEDHSQANASLEKVAMSKGVELPKTLDKKHETC